MSTGNFKNLTVLAAVSAALFFSARAMADSEAGGFVFGGGESESGGGYLWGDSASGGTRWGANESGGVTDTGAESDSGGYAAVGSSSEAGGAFGSGSSSHSTTQSSNVDRPVIQYWGPGPVN